MPEKPESAVSVEAQARAPSSAPALKPMRFRRGRAAKACEVCHTRKVRCDMTENFPCTNCKAFSLVCTPREGRSKTATRAEPSVSPATTAATAATAAATTTASTANTAAATTATANGAGSAGSAPAAARLDANISVAGEAAADAQNELPPEISAGVSLGTRQKTHKVLFMGATSHAVLQDNDTTLRKRLAEDPIIRHLYKFGVDRDLFPYTGAQESMLRSQGAFLLPSPELSDHLVDQFFTYSHPFVPVINRMEFMKLYSHDRDAPPLIMRQAIFCVGARTSTHPKIRDAKGSSQRVALTFYLRAKALYDAEYEKDSHVLMRSALLLGLAIDHPFIVSQNAFYWTRVAITLAQGLGLHRKRSGGDGLEAGTSDGEGESPAEERRQRRVWWTLYVRDVQTAMSYGRPVMINLEDCNVDMVTVDDFIGAEAATIEPGTEVMSRVLSFIQSVRLYEITGLIMRVQYSVGAERLHRLHLLPDVTQCDGALAEWVNQLPAELGYSIRDSSQHEFVRAALYLQYYTVICLAHRPQVSHLFRTSSGDIGQSHYPSWGIAFQAAHMISRIYENLRKFDQLEYLPATTSYTAFLAVMMLAYQRHSNRPAVVEAARQAMRSLITTVSIISRTHETASWITVLGEELLHDDRVALRLARTLWPKRQRDPQDDDADAGTAPKSPKKIKTDTKLEMERQQPLSHQQQPPLPQQEQHQQQQHHQHQRQQEHQQHPPPPPDTADVAAMMTGLPATPAPDMSRAKELHLVTRTPQPVGSEGSLFPGMGGPSIPTAGSSSACEEFGEEAQTSWSSGDEGSLPDTLNMMDWYDFLMAPDAPPGLDAGLDPEMEDDLLANTLL